MKRGHMETRDKRLQILSKSEVEEIYGIPKFSDEDRELHFYVDSVLRSELKKIRQLNAKIYFILQIGYFKAKKMIPLLDTYLMTDDIKYIGNKLFNETIQIDKFDIPISSITLLNTKILNLVSYSFCKFEIKRDIEIRLKNLAKIYTKPYDILKDLINYLESRKIILPGYSYFQESIGNALSKEKKRLGKLILRNTSKEERALFDELLMKEEVIYELQFYKNEPKDFSNKELKNEIDRKNFLQPLFTISQSIVSKFKISNENLDFYGSLVIYYTVSKLKKISGKTIYLYLICFVTIRYKKSYDNIIDSYIHSINSLIKNSVAYKKNKILEFNILGNMNLKKIKTFIDYFLNKKNLEDMKFKDVRKELDEILDDEEKQQLSNFLSENTYDFKKFEWDYFTNFQLKFKTNTRYLFKELDLEFKKSEVDLLEAVNFIKGRLLNKKSIRSCAESDFPLNFIPKRHQKFIIGNQENPEINPDKYEFLIYRLVKERLESGDAYFKYSINFKSLEDDLVSKEELKNMDLLEEKLNIPNLNTPIDKILDALKSEVEAAYLEVNKNILANNNDFVKLIKNEDDITWEVKRETADSSGNYEFYGQFKKINIINLLNFVNHQCDFISAFSHILDKNKKKEVETNILNACLVAFGTNIGLKGISQVSDVKFSILRNAAKSYIRLETLHDANDLIINKIESFEAFKYFKLDELDLHSSSDGQKFGTQFNTINSRYSPKYFGLEKGITSYSLVSNHIPINAKNIGAHEHESHYVFDILFNNTSNINPTIHSTDSHGINRVNFVILDFFGYKFAPRYKAIKSKDNRLAAFDDLSSYKNFIIKPHHKINVDLIQNEWDNIVRIFVSLGLRKLTQSTIVRKFSSYSRKNRTHKALWEYNSIIETLHLLQYLNDPVYRKQISKSLNRGEAYHKLKRAIFHANNGKFRVKTEVEQQIWSECIRLLANCILLYNTYIINQFLLNNKKYDFETKVEAIKKISPTAWQHVNFYGEFEFYRKDNGINFSDMIDSIVLKYFGQNA